jgi:hypothetical protein
MSKNMSTGDTPRSIEAMEAHISHLEARLQQLESIEAIKKLQRAYGYYLDYKLWDEITELFANEGAVVEIGTNGVYHGKEHIRTFFHQDMGGGRSGRLPGRLFNHLQLQGIVDVDPAGKTASGRWRAFTLVAETDPSGNPFNGWGEGVYENEYVCEDGAWKIKSLRWLPSFYGRLDEGTIDTAFLRPPLGEPDEPGTFSETTLRERQLPYHYRHPITGEQTTI